MTTQYITLQAVKAGRQPSEIEKLMGQIMEHCSQEREGITSTCTEAGSSVYTASF